MPVSHPPESTALLRSEWALLGLFAAGKILIHLAVLGRYGIFRDEFYYLACARHLDWGYVDHPPFSIAVLAIWTEIFGDALWALRLPAILAGAATVVVAGLVARELGGRRYAQGLTCLAVLMSPLFLAVSNFYSMNVFEQLFWTILAWILARFLRTHSPRYWLVFGAVAGIALQNKLSVLVLGFGVVVGLLLTRHRVQFLKKEFWIGGAIAGLCILPFLLWQSVNGYPIVEFLHNAATRKNTDSSPLSLFLGLLLEMHPANALLWLPGLAFTLYGDAGKRFRLLGIASITLFLVFGFTNGKVYYVAPAMPILLALGAVAWERWTSKRGPGRVALAAPLVLLGPVLFPLAIPALAPHEFIAYQARLGIGPTEMERHRMGPLPQHFADRFGWRELAAFVDLMCAKYIPEERDRAVVLASNYGEAGALEYYQQEYNLPRVVSPHNSYYLWGPGAIGDTVVLAYGFQAAELAAHFDSVVPTGERYEEPLVMPYQNNRVLFICRGLKSSPDTLWQQLKRFI